MFTKSIKLYFLSKIDKCVVGYYIEISEEEELYLLQSLIESDILDIDNIES
jgi:hypothetical protein